MPVRYSDQKSALFAKRRRPSTARSPAAGRLVSAALAAFAWLVFLHGCPSPPGEAPTPAENDPIHAATGNSLPIEDETGAIPLQDLPPATVGQQPTPAEPAGLEIRNGWLVHNGRVVWGYGQHNSWWRTREGANITRNNPGVIGPNHTEDLDKLTDNMLRYAYPAFEHNYGLWYDRRRDRHDTQRRSDANAVPPFLEQPWARSGIGTAWDGLSRYDLTRYNPWYFDRLKTFAALCDAKGTVLFHNFYMQHALLEFTTHYVDFPWRPVNCIQNTNMPDDVPAANAFYDTSDPVRRSLHQAYIRKCLDELGGYSNVFHLCSQEYTGPLSFMRFWLDTVSEWESQNHRDVKVCLGGTKDVLDALAADPRVSALDLRYFSYRPNGSLYAPPGGQQIAGRYTAGFDAAATSPYQIYRQVREYRLAYPDKPIIHMIAASRQQSWAFLMAGGSVILRFMEYPDFSTPPDYIAPAHAPIIQPTYDFIDTHLSDRLFRMMPADLVNNPQDNWCLAEPGHTYLVYALHGGSIDLDLTAAAGKTLRAQWFNPRTGSLTPAHTGQVAGGATASFSAPDTNDWALLVDLP